MNLFIMLCSYYNVTCILSYYLQKKKTQPDSDVCGWSAGEVWALSTNLDSSGVAGLCRSASSEANLLPGVVGSAAWWGLQEWLLVCDPQTLCYSLPFTAVDGNYFTTVVKMLLVLAKLSSCICSRTLVKEEPEFNFPVRFENHIC